MINILDIQVANIIAAGEVIDRPSSALKELLENAIDAGSTAVTVEIRGGGSEFMLVRDNGCGMGSEDLMKCLFRHATSKIKSAADLDSLFTLGFRGEALAAISSVSDLKIITREKNADTGYFLEAHNGKIVEMDKAGSAVGTTVVMERLYYNVPARRKFLKSNVTEAGSCRWIAEKIALARPDISFRFLSDGKEKLFTPGRGVYSAVHGVFGAEEAGEFLCVNEFELNGIKISGYISKIENGKSTRTDQNFFVNNRYVRSKTVSASLENAYKSIADTSDFPSCVLYINIKENQVDVNVHPQKLEVKFSDDSKIAEAVYYAAKNTLSKQRNDEFTKYNKPAQKTDYARAFVPAAAISETKMSEYTEAMSIISSNKTPGVNVTEQKAEEKNFSLYNPAPDISKNDFITPNIPYGEEIKPEEKTELSEPESGLLEEEYKIIGEAFMGYIIVEFPDRLVFIDKHAAHERILYDELSKKAKRMEQGDIQILLEPLTLKFNAYEFSPLSEYKSEIEKIGINYNCDEDTNEIIVYETDPVFTGCDLKEVFEQIAEAVNETGVKSAAEVVDGIYFSASRKITACKAAMKMGREDNSAHITWLVGRALTHDVMCCPHGRPFYYVVEKKKLDKIFGRI